MPNAFPQVPRDVFRAAIAAASLAVPPPEPFAAQLSLLAEEAESFGTNFNTEPGCPAALTGWYEPGVLGHPAEWAFHFDRALGAYFATIGQPNAFDSERIHVV